MIFFDARWAGKNGIGQFSERIEKSMNCKRILSGLDRFGFIPSMKLSLFMIRKAYRNEAASFYSPGIALLYIPNFLRKRVKIGITVHDTFFLDRSNNFGLVRFVLFKFIVRWFVEKYDFVFTVSDYSKMKIEAWLGDKARAQIVNIGNGNPLQGAEQNNPEISEEISEIRRSDFILFVGNNRPHKNFNLFYKSFLKAKDTALGESLRLVAIGVEPVENAICLTDISDYDLIALYQSARCLIIPSLDEGFCYPAVEANSLGCPVIHSERGALPETLKPNLFKFNPMCADSMYEAILFIASAELETLPRQSSCARQWTDISSSIQNKLGR